MRIPGQTPAQCGLAARRRWQAHCPPTFRLDWTLTLCCSSDAAPLFCAMTVTPAAADAAPSMLLCMSKVPASRLLEPPAPPLPPAPPAAAPPEALPPVPELPPAPAIADDDPAAPPALGFAALPLPPAPPAPAEPAGPLALPPSASPPKPLPSELESPPRALAATALPPSPPRAALPPAALPP